MAIRAHQFALLDFLQYLASAKSAGCLSDAELFICADVVEIHADWRKNFSAVYTGFPFFQGANCTLEAFLVAEYSSSYG